ncbi:MAG TPA: hypothetical protein DCL35_02555 [Candidatus Omnitrophica bacterium]|nr:hypothetical protein [Candidatus Omnitrophota bacterium]
MAKNKKKRKKLMPKIKKDILDFCFSEEGKISKKTVAKLGLTMAMLSASVKALEACHGSGTSTANAFFSAGQGGHQSGTTHASHPSHTSHGSHGQW